MDCCRTTCISVAPQRDEALVGLKPGVLAVCQQEEVTTAEIFVKLMFGDQLVASAVKLNRTIQNYNNNHNNRRMVKLFTMSKFYHANTMFIGAICFAANGSALFKDDDSKDKDHWITIEPSACLTVGCQSIVSRSSVNSFQSSTRIQIEDQMTRGGDFLSAWMSLILTV